MIINYYVFLIITLYYQFRTHLLGIIQKNRQVERFFHNDQSTLAYLERSQKTRDDIEKN